MKLIYFSSAVGEYPNMLMTENKVASILLNGFKKIKTMFLRLCLPLAIKPKVQAALFALIGIAVFDPTVCYGLKTYTKRGAENITIYIVILVGIVLFSIFLQDKQYFNKMVFEAI